jgi:hypothetical protein
MNILSPWRQWNRSYYRISLDYKYTDWHSHTVEVFENYSNKWRMSCSILRFHLPISTSFWFDIDFQNAQCAKDRVDKILSDQQCILCNDEETFQKLQLLT